MTAGLTPGWLAPVLGFYSVVELRWWDRRVVPARWVDPGGLPGPSTWLLAWEAISRSVEYGRQRETAS